MSVIKLLLFAVGQIMLGIGLFGLFLPCGEAYLGAQIKPED
tara:strand:+ start:183 stop:305 length:123 start_codon:yes stop_codon:yes gene_type:complete